MKTDKLFGVSIEVANAMKETMTHTEYLKVGIVLMDRVQRQNLNDHMSDDFKYRAKAIKNYSEWLKE